MVFISATRLGLKSLFFLPGFMRANNASIKRLVVTEGFLSGKELVDKGLVFWTLTMWDKDADMKSFRNSVPHRNAMQQLPRWCDEATYVHWQQEEALLPDWDIIHSRMVNDGTVSKVRKASERHSAKLFPTIKWQKSGRVFKPALK